MSYINAIQGDSQNAYHQFMILAFNGLNYLAVILNPVSISSKWASTSVIKGFK
jgi:hypothetical protein